MDQTILATKTIDELKAMAYDALLNLNQANATLQAIEQEIRNRPTAPVIAMPTPEPEEE